VKDGQPSHAATILHAIAQRQGFELTHSKDGNELGPEGLKKYDAFVFYTTGDLTQPGTDKQPPMPDKQAFLDAIAGGKGFVGLHSATDTFHSAADRFQDDGAGADPFIKMIGGEFIAHGAQQTAKVFCTGSKFPGLEGCGKEPFDLHEEFYSFKNLAKDLHVLQWLGTWSLKNTGKDSVYRRAPFPLTWARMHGRGRVFYTALGHREDVWTSEAYQKMLAGAIAWATGEARATLRPNVAQVTPFFAELPPKDPRGDGGGVGLAARGTAPGAPVATQPPQPPQPTTPSAAPAPPAPPTAR
jgi:uncharacterized protein